jgi:hypothetical protein
LGVSDDDAPEELDLPNPSSPKAVNKALAKASRNQKVDHKDKSDDSQKFLEKRPRSEEVHHRSPTSSAAQRPKVSKAKAKTEATPAAEEADVQQLGGQLQDIMSQLNDPTLVEQKPSQPLATPDANEQVQPDTSSAEAPAEQTETLDTPSNVETPAENTVAEEKAPAEDPPNEDSSSSVNSQMEKLPSEEVSKDDVATAADDGKQQEAENAVDGAMAYIRTRLATEEHTGLRLRQLLAQSVRENRKLRHKVEQMHKQALEDTRSRKTVSAVANQQLKRVESELSQEKHRAEIAEMRAQNATRAATIGEKTMKMLAKHLKYSKSKVASLLINLANASHEKDDLSRQLRESVEHDQSEAKELATTKKELQEEAKELAETREKLTKLEKVKAVEEKSLVALDRQKDLLEQRQKSSVKRDQILHKENNVLKTQLAAEVKREEQLREMWSKESEAFTWQLRAERANATEALGDLEKARGEFHDLRKRVQALREKAGKEEAAKRAAEDSANKAQFALSQAEAENKQLRGSVPWLEAQVNRQRQITANATTQMKKAVSERDTLRSILAEAQKNIVQLQGQYADSLRALVVAQAGGDSEATSQQKAAAAASTARSTNSNNDNLIDTFANLNLGNSGLPNPGDIAGSDDASFVEVGASRQDLHHDSSANPHKAK